MVLDQSSNALVVGCVRDRVPFTRIASGQAHESFVNFDVAGLVAEQEHDAVVRTAQVRQRNESPTLYRQAR